MRRSPADVLDPGCDDGGDDRERCGTAPGGSETGRDHQQLAEWRPKRQSEIKTQRVVTYGLAHPARWREIGNGSDCRDKEGSFCHSEQQTQQHNQHKVVGVRGPEHSQCAEEPATDKQGTPPAGVRQAAGDGPQNQGADGEGSERQAGARRVGTDRASYPERQRVDRDAGGGEVREVSNRQPDEGGGEQAVARGWFYTGCRERHTNSLRVNRVAWHGQNYPDRSKQPVLHGEHCGSRTGCGADLEIDVLNVVLDSASRQHESFRDLGVGQPE